MTIPFWKYRSLILQMAQREVLGRYRGSVLGLAWSFFSPILMLTVYTFVFSYVMKSRWQSLGEQQNHGEFAIVLFAGLIVHGLFAECINRAPLLIVGNANYVKKVIFPLEILPLISLSSACFHACISLAVMLAAQAILGIGIPATALLVPTILPALLLLTVGLTWIIAALSVFLRDIAQTTGIFTSMLLFMSPVFYPSAAIPEKYRIFLQLNPLTPLIENTRRMMIFGEAPNWNELIIVTLVSVVIALLGYRCFQALRQGFADVL
ncbi:ABC transporter permease [Chitinimonas koreensis]|uniref:ABC transporter permease n=1 Tax=Chitinimonas koreensis TaxID=356302 RepID=UPI00055716EC|nr:ABC transporter permease [Chitinimonas koreensis]QNM96972.1 ABC transporter permease [Chitinimonas koreensis]